MPASTRPRLDDLRRLTVVQMRRRLHDPMLDSVAFLLAPFAEYLLAEVVHASGVLAVVVCGLIMS